MMHRAWSSIVDVPYCFSRSYFKFQGHTALKIVEFDPNWAFPDSNSSLNSLMAMKCCTKLETAKERCPIWFSRSSIKFQGHTGQNITDFDPNWAFPDYRPVAAFKSLRFALFKIIHQISRSHGLKNQLFESNLSKIIRSVAAIKSLRFALFDYVHIIVSSWNFQKLSPRTKRSRWEVISQGDRGHNPT